NRFNIDAFYHPNGDRNVTISNRAGYFVGENVPAFEAAFFSISPAETRAMDPMQRILLEVVYETMESAGIPITKLAGTDTSCFVGCFTSDYNQIANKDPELLPKYHATGTGQAILSNCISYCFDLKSPSALPRVVVKQDQGS
ncbi:beta-ketoacyl synthase, partial [Massarina eburnea CBS 473.64]